MTQFLKWINMTWREVLYSLIVITCGCLIYAFGINSFVIPNNFGNGGVSGIAILVYYVTHISTGTTNFIINTLLLLIGWRFLEKRTLIFTIFTMIIISLCLNWLHPAPFQSSSIVLCAIGGGACIGTGMGLVLLGNGTTAGGDIIAMLLKKYLGMSFSLAVLLVDAMVVLWSSFIIGYEKTVVTLVMMFISSNAINVVTEGLKRKKSLMVISTKPELIAEEIMRRLDRGITVLKGYGYFSKEEKEILYVIISRRQILTVQRMIAEVDAEAFVTITDVQQVIGQGFTFFNASNRNRKVFLK